MIDFGTRLRITRKRCIDPDIPGRSLTQERFGEFLGRELGIHGSFSGAAISDWERGKSKIRADDRLVLMCILTVFYNLNGINSVAEANEFLEAGNYRALNRTEIERIFAEHHETLDLTFQPEDIQPLPLFSIDKLLLISSEELTLQRKVPIKSRKNGCAGIRSHTHFFGYSW